MGSLRRWIVGVLLVVVALAGHATLLPEAVPFIVNTVTTGLQQSPSGGIDGGGVGLIAWHTDGLGQDETEIAGRLVDAAGAVVGDEFQINTYTSHAQIRPVVAALSEGGFVVAWESYVVATDEDEVFIRRFAADGAPLGDELKVDDTEFHLHLDVAETASGGFVLVWDDGFDIFGRTFDSAGGSVGDAFQVNVQSGTMYGPSVAAAAGGAFTVTWEDRSEIDGDGAGVLMRRFASDGSPLGGDMQVNTSTGGDQYAPAIGMRDDGEFMVVWEAYGQEGLGDGAFGQLFDSSGAALGDEFRVDDERTAYAGYLDASGTESGFIVVWNEPRDPGGDILTTRARRFGADGVAAAVVDVDPQDQGDQAGGVVDSRDGISLIAWEGFGPDEQDIFAQRFAEVAPTPTPGVVCAGDCDGDGSVSVAELIRAVNIALGTLDVSQCTAVDGDGDGAVAINELIAAVNSALDGCPG